MALEAQDKGHLLVAGVGDSRCMLGRLQPGGEIRAIPMSIDHTPDNPTEASRVCSNGVVSSNTRYSSVVTNTVMPLDDSV